MLMLDGHCISNLFHFGTSCPFIKRAFVIHMTKLFSRRLRLHIKDAQPSWH